MDIFEEIVQSRKSGRPVVLVTVVLSKGSAPREEGARMLVRADGSIAGTIGGGALEQKVIEEALAILEGGASRLISYDLKEIGMTAGGSMSVFVEPLEPAPQLVIFGAGHIGVCLARMGKMLDFSVTVADNRPEFASAERLPWADTIIAGEYAESVQRISFSERSCVVILTHKHVHDFELLAACLGKPSCYLGMIGSRIKVAEALAMLRAKGIDEDEIGRIHAPIGLRIGAQTPAEIAVSIFAEIVQVRRSQSRGAGQAGCCNPRA